ncbi:hypothetical protein EDD17DRAFT_235131 [Pisolithus thermaeus]|nr:hypothetical protein EDD17DRAFT_235131 [Pisolithus thermaeus]
MMETCCSRGRTLSAEGVGRAEAQRMHRRLFSVPKEFPSLHHLPLSLKRSLMFTKTFLSTVAAAALFAASVSGIFPGYKFGITQNGDNGTWQVFDNSCHVVYQVTSKNPWAVGVFDGGSTQSSPTALHLNGQNDACQADTNPDSCNGHFIQVCCN